MLEQEFSMGHTLKSYVFQDSRQISNLYIEYTKADFKEFRTAEKIL